MMWRQTPCSKDEANNARAANTQCTLRRVHERGAAAYESRIPEEPSAAANTWAKEPE